MSLTIEKELGRIPQCNLGSPFARETIARNIADVFVGSAEERARLQQTAETVMGSFQNANLHSDSARRLISDRIVGEFLAGQKD